MISRSNIQLYFLKKQKNPQYDHHTSSIICDNSHEKTLYSIFKYISHVSYYTISREKKNVIHMKCAISDDDGKNISSYFLVKLLEYHARKIPKNPHEYPIIILQKSRKTHNMTIIHLAL